MSAQRTRRAWLHSSGTVCLLATPVVVLAMGPKQARVRLVHRLRWNRTWLPAGTVRQVPRFAVGDRPASYALVGVGRGKFVSQSSRAGNAAVARWGAK